MKCDKSCTASCCVGCLDIMPSIQNAMAVFSSPTGGTASIRKVFGDSYGLATRGGYTLTYTPPVGVSGALSSIESSLGGGSIMPLLLVGLAAFLVLK